MFGFRIWRRRKSRVPVKRKENHGEVQGELNGVEYFVPGSHSSSCSGTFSPVARQQCQNGWASFLVEMGNALLHTITQYFLMY